MTLNAPNQTVWLIAVILGVVGLLGRFAILPMAVLTTNAFWLVAIAFVILALATMMKGV